MHFTTQERCKRALGHLRKQSVWIFFRITPKFTAMPPYTQANLRCLFAFFSCLMAVSNLRLQDVHSLILTWLRRLGVRLTLSPYALVQIKMALYKYLYFDNTIFNKTLATLLYPDMCNQDFCRNRTNWKVTGPSYTYDSYTHNPDFA